MSTSPAVERENCNRLLYGLRAGLAVRIATGAGSEIVQPADASEALLLRMTMGHFPSRNAGELEASIRELLLDLGLRQISDSAIDYAVRIARGELEDGLRREEELRRQIEQAEAEDREGEEWRDGRQADDDG